MDVVRIRDDGNTLFESCGSVAGERVISNTNVVMLNLVASSRFYPARGFLLQYQGSRMKYFGLNDFKGVLVICKRHISYESIIYLLTNNSIRDR